MRNILSSIVLYTVVFRTSGLEIVNQWNLLNFDFPSNSNYQDFRPENTILTGLEVTDDRIFLALPSLRAGVPASVAFIPRNTPPGANPVLQAYPDWSYHRGGNSNLTCSGLISVYRVRTDSCNRLWVLDSGTMTTLDSYQRVCTAKLVAFDLNTNQPVRTIVLPEDVLRPVSALTNFVIDESIQGKCDSAFIYITDTIAAGLIVYDGLKDKAWRFQHPSMFPNPDHGSFNIAGDTFQFMDGILGLAHSPHLATIFYQPMAASKIFSVSTSYLIKGPPAELEEFPVTVAGTKSSQGLGLSVNPLDDTLYFGPFTETSIASWNIVTNEQRLLAQDPINLQFTAELRWKEDGSIWVLSSRFHKFFKRTVTPNEINLRIMRIPPTSTLYTDALSNKYYY